MIRVFASLAFLSLTGCHILFPEDPRLGEETLEQCLARVTPTTNRDEVFELAGDDTSLWVPTYTYDVTKLDLDAIKELSVPGTDETAGSRMTLTTNETSTAVDRYMREPVDEKGSFFLGHDPALFRVRGEPMIIAEVLSAGCERQLANMRLIDVDVEIAPPENQPIYCPAVSPPGEPLSDSVPAPECTPQDETQ